MDLKDYPEFQDLVDGGAPPGLDGSSASQEHRAFLLNSCSMCEAVSFHAAFAFMKHKQERSRGLRGDYSVTDVVDNLCSERNVVWKQQYGVTRGTIGLLVGPGISTTRRQQAVRDPSMMEGVAMRLSSACSDMLGGGEQDEQHWFDVTEQALRRNKHEPTPPGEVIVALTKSLCDSRSAPCGRYTAQYPGHQTTRDPRDLQVDLKDEL